MTRETVDSAPKLSLKQKVYKLITWLLHRDGPARNWRYVPTHLLLRKLRSESAEMRAYAAEGLGGVGDVHAVTPLINALDDNTAPLMSLFHFCKTKKPICEVLLPLPSEN